VKWLRGVEKVKGDRSQCGVNYGVHYGVHYSIKCELRGSINFDHGEWLPSLLLYTTIFELFPKHDVQKY
jgi:hypothetical protein